MVFASEQYDQYQQIANKMTQYHNQQQSEELVANSPGLTALIPGTQNCPTTGYTCYSMSLSNLGGVGVQIARIYINSTGPAGSGCSSPNPQPCILNPSSTIASYTFSQATQFLNPGETNHAVLLFLPSSVNLPSVSVSLNTIVIVTTRGGTFSFQWPFQLQNGGQSQAAFSTGTMKIAYQAAKGSGGYDSAYDYKSATGHTAGTYCHNEPLGTYPAGSNSAEQLSVPGVPDGSGVLTFVNPWITQKIFSQPNGVYNSGTPTSPTNKTTLYIYVNVTNTGTIAYSVLGGTMDLTWYGSNHVDGGLIGIYYGLPTGTFYTVGTAPAILPGKYFYAIFRVASLTLGDWTPPTFGVMFWGSASLTDSAEDLTFIAGVGLMSGLWIRPSC